MQARDIRIDARLRLIGQRLAHVFLELGESQAFGNGYADRFQ